MCKACQHGIVHHARTLSGTKCLTARKERADTGCVPDKEGTGFGDSIYTRRTTAPRRLFFVRAIASPMSGSGGDTFGYAGFPVYRFANPAICCSPRLATGCAVQHHTREAIMPSINTPVQTPSKSEAIKRIAGYANAVNALLETYLLIPAADQADILAVAASMADDVARDLAALNGGAA